MSDKKGAKTFILIIFIIDFSTEKLNILYNDALIMTKKYF